MRNTADFARGLLPPWPPHDVAQIYSGVPEREPKEWAAQFGNDFVGAWQACPEPDWLIIFALIIAMECEESTKARVADAISRALGVQDQLPPRTAATSGEREAFARLLAGDAAGIEFFRDVGATTQPRPSAEILRDLRAALDGREMLRESGLVP